MRLELPTVYVVFYDYFFKSSVGDAAWKRSLEGRTGNNADLGSVTEEAFAMVLLKNNYFAWLFQAKEEMQGLLVTDYDSDARRKDFKSIHEVYLLMGIDLKEETRERMLVVKGRDSYKQIEKKTDEIMKGLRRKARDSMEYQNVLEKLEDASNSSDDEYSQRKKKRKKLKEFKAYTSQKEGEGKFKGWSSRVASDMSSIVEELNEEKEERKKFNFVYRTICATRLSDKRGGKQPPAPKEKVAEEVINKCDDLDRIEMVEL